jgi:hypothetical protein
MITDKKSSRPGGFFMFIYPPLTLCLSVCGLSVNEMTTNNQALNLLSYCASNKQETHCRTTKNSLYEKIC